MPQKYLGLPRIYKVHHYSAGDNLGRFGNFLWYWASASQLRTINTYLTNISKTHIPTKKNLVRLLFNNRLKNHATECLDPSQRITPGTALFSKPQGLRLRWKSKLRQCDHRSSLVPWRDYYARGETLQRVPWSKSCIQPLKIRIYIMAYMAVCQNLVPLVNIKIAGKWMFIPLKMVLIGIDPYPYGKLI